MMAGLNLTENSIDSVWGSEKLGEDIINFGKKLKKPKLEKKNLIFADFFLDPLNATNSVLTEQPEIYNFKTYIRSYFRKSSWEQYIKSKKPSSFHTDVFLPFMYKSVKYISLPLIVGGTVYTIYCLKTGNVDALKLVEQLKQKGVELQELLELAGFKIDVLQKKLATIENVSTKLIVSERMKHMLIEKNKELTLLLENCVTKKDSSLIDILFRQANLDCIFEECLTEEAQKLVTKMILAQKDLPLIAAP